MKRLIKYHSPYASDGAKFSDCSTKYEILPELVENDAGFEELKALAAKHGIKIGRKFEVPGAKESNCHRSTTLMTHAVNVMETVTAERFNGTETHQVYLGFIRLNENGSLKPSKRINLKLTLQQAGEIVNNQEYGVSDVGTNVDKKEMVIKSGWNYYHEIPMLGYSLESFEKVLKIEDHGFYDDTFRCGDCCTLDSNDNGHNYNYKIIEGNIVGIHCGCAKEYEDTRSPSLKALEDTLDCNSHKGEDAA